MNDFEFKKDKGPLKRIIKELEQNYLDENFPDMLKLKILENWKRIKNENSNLNMDISKLFYARPTF